MAERRIPGSAARAGRQRPVLHRLRQRRLLDLLRTRDWWPPTRSGLTPIVFVITGVIFYLTAATYAEATAMYPEAGGSSSFARHAFNEFWSFFAAWAQMLNYTITIAISAFFVPHYLGGLFFPFLKTSPGDVFFGIGVVVVLCGDQHRRRHRGGGAQYGAGHHRLLHPAAARRAGRGAGARPSHAGPQRPSGHRAQLEELPDRDPGGDDRLHGDRDDLQHGRGGQGRVTDDSQGDQPRGHSGVRDLRGAAGGGPVGAAGHLLHGQYHAAGRSPRAREGTPATQSWGSSSTFTSGRCSTPARSTSVSWPRRSCSSPPTPGSSASRGWSTRWVCTARCPMGFGACTLGSARRGSAS